MTRNICTPHSDGSTKKKMCFLKTVPYVPVEEANFERVSNFGQKKGFLV